MSRKRWAAWGVGVVLLAACSSGSAAPTGAATPSIDPAVAHGEECRPLELRAPNGERVDLTGTWEGGVFVHHVRQVGDCAWWIGYGRWPGTELGELATLTFFGRLASDFTLAGSWATIVQPSAPGAYYPGPPAGSVAFLIDFDPETGVATTLTRVGAGRTDPEYPTDELRLVGPLPDSANPPQY